MRSTRLGGRTLEADINQIIPLLSNVSYNPSNTITRVYNVVTDYGAVGDGVTDDATAFQNAIDAIPVNDDTWASVNGKPASTYMIFIPTPSTPTNSYIIGSQLTIPANTSVYFLGSGPWGPRLEYTGAGNYMFLNDNGGGTSWRTLAFVNLAFDSGGVEIEGDSRGVSLFQNCVFADCAGYAILGSGTSIVGGEVINCKFGNNAGAISLNNIDCDNWFIRQNSFVRQDACDILIGSTGVNIIDNDFETRDNVAAPNEAWICTSLGETKIMGNRFGDEAPSGHAPPRDAIIIGPLSTTSATAVPDIEISRNVFRGTNGTPGASEADSAIRLNAPPERVRVFGNSFSDNYNTALIREQFVDDQITGAANANQNYWIGNSVYHGLDTDVFSHRGWAWQGDSPDIEPKLAFKLWQNQLRLTDTLTNTSIWLQTNATVAKNATDPGGVASNAFTITKTAGTGVAHIRTQVQNVSSFTEDAITFSCWLKKGTMDRARLYLIQTTDNNPASSRFETIRLTDDWRLYHITAKQIDTTKAFFCYIAVGAETTADNALTGTILAYGPQAVDGYAMAPWYMPNIDSGGTVHAALSARGYVIGNMFVDYGSAAPGSGRYEVGDKIIDEAPVADSGPNMTTTSSGVGWVCTTAGAPGTWKVFGDIAA